MLTRGYKTGSPRLENRKERIPETVGGESRVTLERSGRQADWRGDIHRGPRQRAQTNTLGPAQRQGAVLTAWGRDHCRPNSFRAQGKSMWKATVCSSEIIQQPQHWMNNTSSQAAAWGPQTGSFQRKNKQSKLGKTVQTRISKEEDFKMCLKDLNTESFSFCCGKCEKVDIIIDPQWAPLFTWSAAEEVSRQVCPESSAIHLLQSGNRLSAQGHLFTNSSH